MRILLTTWQGKGAGSIQSVQNLAEGLVARGHRIAVMTPGDGVLGRRLHGGPVEVIDHTFPAGWSATSARRLAGVVRAGRFDLVDAQESRDRKAAILARLFFGMRVPLLISRRQMSHTFPIQNFVYGTVADRVVANSHGVAKSLRGVPRRKITVVSTGHNPVRVAGRVSEAEAEELRRGTELKPELPTVGMVARRKDQETLLRALSRLNRPVNVLFVGVERDERLAALEPALPPGSHTAYTGWVTRPAPYYRLLDVMALPSFNEGIPQAVFESMALGVPVVAADIGGTAEAVIDGENGLLFPPGDAATLADKLCQVLDDGELRRRFQAKGRETVAGPYHFDRMVEETERVYREILGASG
ncbi:MAG: glycosyltransferase family 4 protein [Longimicrobiaceae bacterium]